MDKRNKQKLSMFSKETLDSLAMAEVLGGDNNTKCVNNGCNTSCTNTCQNASDCTNTKCKTNFNCIGDCDCSIVTPIDINGKDCVDKT